MRNRARAKEQTTSPNRKANGAKHIHVGKVCLKVLLKMQYVKAEDPRRSKNKRTLDVRGIYKKEKERDQNTAIAEKIISINGRRSSGAVEAIPDNKSVCCCQMTD